MEITVQVRPQPGTQSPQCHPVAVGVTPGRLSFPNSRLLALVLMLGGAPRTTQTVASTSKSTPTGQRNDALPVSFFEGEEAIDY
jgi:hypothetical protein